MIRILLTLFLALSSSLYAKEIHQFSLPNGLTVIVLPDHRSNVVISQVWYKVGSSHEVLGLTGVSHALEHMMFQGTKKIGPGEFSKLISEHGGQQNAMTTTDYTMYYQEVEANSLPLCLELEADRMQNLLIASDLFAREKKVVIEERRLRTDDNPQGLLFERLNASAYIASPYHHPVVGWMNDIEYLTAANLKHWYQRWYKPSNAILVVVGNVDPEKVHQLAKSYFGKLPFQPTPKLKPQKEVPLLGKRELTVETYTSLPSIMFGYNVPSFKTAKKVKDAVSLLVLENILAGGYNSRFERELVHDKALAAGVNANYEPLHRLDTLFMLYAVPTPQSNLAQLKIALLEQVEKLKASPISSQELKNAITRVKANFIYQQDSFNDQASLLGNLAILDLPLNMPDEILLQLEYLTPQDIQKVAQQYLTDIRLTIAMLKPIAKTRS